jgi:hypothetical protein
MSEDLGDLKDMAIEYLPLSAMMILFSFLIYFSVFSYLEELGFKFEKSKKRRTLWFVFSIIFILTMYASIVYSWLSRWHA